MEQFECVNCHVTTTLDVHGRCSSCGSTQVISEHLLQRALLLREHFTPHIQLYRGFDRRER